MIKRIRALVTEYREQLTYIFFGALTTLVSWAGYWLLYEALGAENVPSTIISELAAITFAFVTNKIWVFRSKSWRGLALFNEIKTFYACRALAFLLTLGFMYLTVDVFEWHAMLMRGVITIVVVIVNYFASKFLVFKKR